MEIQVCDVILSKAIWLLTLLKGVMFSTLLCVYLQHPINIQNTGIFINTAVRTNFTLRTSCLYSPLVWTAVLKFRA